MLGDPRYLDDSSPGYNGPAGFELQYATEIGAVSPSAGDYIRSVGDIVGGIQQALNNATLNEIQRQQLQAQLERARMGVAPINYAQPMGNFGAGINWQMVGLLALAAGGVWFLTSRKGR